MMRNEVKELVEQTVLVFVSVRLEIKTRMK